VSYSIRSEYYLLRNYDIPENFRLTTVQASKKYHQIFHTQKIEFDNPTPPLPLDLMTGSNDMWSSLHASGLPVVGVAFGLIFYIKNKRFQKNV
jgi:hypothetical protein